VTDYAMEIKKYMTAMELAEAKKSFVMEIVLLIRFITVKMVVLLFMIPIWKTIRVMEYARTLIYLVTVHAIDILIK